MRIAIVNGICIRHDAISDSVRGMQRAIADAYGREPPIYCYACDYSTISHRIIHGVTDLLFDPEFMSADLVIYHFGVHYDLFDSIHLGFKGRRAVYYHNVTPARFLPPAQQAVIARSMRQKASLSAADAIWAASRFNRDDLIDVGLSGDNITVEPLFVKFSDKIEKRRTPKSNTVELLFVGRLVESKGLIDLIDAVSAVRQLGIAPIRLRMAGNLQFSDQTYIDLLRKRVEDSGLADVVSFEGQVSDTRLAELYAMSDLFVLPSYHEGFCVPLIEALHARCVPLTYDAGNMPDLIRSWGVTTPTGDRTALAVALADLVGQFSQGRPDRLRLAGREIAWCDYDQGVGRYLEDFTYQAFAHRIVSAVERLLAPARRPVTALV